MLLPPFMSWMPTSNHFVMFCIQCRKNWKEKNFHKTKPPLFLAAKPERWSEHGGYSQFQDICLGCRRNSRRFWRMNCKILSIKGNDLLKSRKSRTWANIFESWFARRLNIFWLYRQIRFVHCATATSVIKSFFHKFCFFSNCTCTRDRMHIFY